MPIKNEIGNTYGYLTVIERAKNNKDGRAQWLCQCKCGNQIVVRSDSLRSGHTTSCGCKRAEILRQSGLNQKKDLVGKTFGYLTVIDDDGTRSNNGEVKWLCECSCGQRVYVTTGNLTRKKDGTISCGCKKSRGEAAIIKSLIALQIPFISQKRFDTCIFPETNRQLVFDFYLPEQRLCIEYDGIQHFEEVKNDFFDFEAIQKRDVYKDQWCKENNITLVRIPYTKLEDITPENMQAIIDRYW